MTKLQYRLYKIHVGVGVIAIILSFPLAFVLPVEVSFENGLLENAQVIILICAAIFLLSIRSQMKWLQRLFAAGLFLMALRELSWGRVFFPLQMESLGPVFVDMEHYPYRVLVYIFLAAYIAVMLFVLIRFVPVRKILLSPQPVAAFAVIIANIIFSYIGDHGYFIGKNYGQIFEEINETIMYFMLPAVNLYYRR